MHTNNTNTRVSESISNRKSFHQLFNPYIAVIFIAVSLLLVVMFWLIVEQHKHSQAIMSEQVAPVQLQLVEQKYLINIDQLIEKLLNEASFIELKSLLNDLTVQSKKLSLLDTNQKKSYQQWLENNNVAINLLNDVEAKHPNNELLKSNMLLLLDTLIDAIDIELNDGEVLRKQKLILNKAQNHLMAIVLKLKNLSLQSTFSNFLQLSKEINALFIEDYGKQLADTKNGSDNVEEIVKDFLRLEDLIVKRGMLSRWEKQLELIDNYQHSLVEQQEMLVSILSELSNNVSDSPSLIEAKFKRVNTPIFLMPIWILVFFICALLTVLTLLLFLSYRIKKVNKLNVNCIQDVIRGNKKIGAIDSTKSNIYSAESLQLIKDIQTACDKNFSQTEYLTLSKQNTELQEQLEKNERYYEQCYEDLNVAHMNKSTKSTVDKISLNNLHTSAIKQLIHMGNSAINSTLPLSVSTADFTSNNREHSYLYDAFLQGRYLVERLSQINYYHYLRSEEGILTFSDVNIAAQIHAVLFNFQSELLLCRNRITLNIDERVNASVSLDVELFSEMLKVFINLSFAQQTSSHLILNILLTDKNTGQQELNFTSEVIRENHSEDINTEGVSSKEINSEGTSSKGISSEKISAEELKPEKKNSYSLPPSLIAINEDIESNNELIDYFKILLHYQHAGNPTANPSEKGYKLGFTLPVAITNKKIEDNHLKLTFPTLLEGFGNHWNNLSTTYLTMPIEILLAIKEPTKSLTLQHTLHAIGLQTTCIASELQLKTVWQSGRFAVLITDMDCQPFIHFAIEEHNHLLKMTPMPRGVFSLTNAIVSKPESFSHWNTGQLTADSNIDEVIKVMAPWLKCVNNADINIEQAGLNLSDESTGAPSNILEVATLKNSFDFDRYIKYHGSVEVALLMFEEYTNENTALVEEFTKAFYKNDMKQLEASIQKLQLNSNILGADGLMALCLCWQKYFLPDVWDNTDKAQINLLSQTQQAVKDVSLSAEAIF